MKKLLLEITSCEYFKNGVDESHPCHKILSCQSGKNRHVPEPWNGKIETAPILFISSNPAINSLEEFPNLSWKEDRIIDFFDNRFSLEKNLFLKDKYLVKGRKPLLVNGGYGKAPPFWGSAKNTATEVLEEPAIAGKDYAIMEIVRCKSGGETGVSKARPTCVDKFLKPTLKLSPAKLIVSIGKEAEGPLRRIFNIAGKSKLSQISYDGIERTIVFLPHPASFGKSRIENVLSEEELRFVQQLLK